MTLRDANLVWSTDITYVPIPSGFMYLSAVIDWYSRYVIAWELSNTLDHLFCVSMLEEALYHAHPVIFNTDQGSQFTSTEFTQCLLNRDILISMDGRGRALDNVFIDACGAASSTKKSTSKTTRASQSYIKAWASTFTSTTTNARTAP